MKITKTLRSILALMLALALCFALAACGNKKADDQSDTDDSASTTDNAQTDDNQTDDADSSDADSQDNDAQNTSEGAVYNVAIVKQMDHESLDEISNAVGAQLDALAKENNVTINYKVYSGQNDQSVLKQIGDQVIGEGVDAIIPIATLAAEVMTVCAEDTQTPVIYAAVSDPAKSDLTGLEYVSGTSDALNTEFIFDMMLAQNPDVQTVGLLYSLSETNSATPIEQAKAYLDSKNIKYIESTGNTNDEIIAAASVLCSDKVDAVFTPTDNVVMAAELSIADDFIEAGIPHYTGADSFVRSGAFITCGVNYTDLGTKTADLAYQAMDEGMLGLDDYYLMDGGIITVNTDTAAALNIDYSMFSTMGELVEVTTVEE